MLYRDSDYERFADSANSETSENYRSAFRKDYGRLLHSAAFRRLQGKTQLFPGDDSDFFRNRLTHSLEVAQIAHCVASKINSDFSYFLLSPIDLDLVEFSALAHDLGHPPFGHNGEYTLNELMKDHGGFEGNAQTLRILTNVCRKVEAKASDDSQIKSFGLNLTKRSIASIIKYDHIIPTKAEADSIGKAKLSKGYYSSETALVDSIKHAVIGSPESNKPVLPAGKFKTLECSIMDLSDDISYSTYDFEDAFKAGFLTPLDLIVPDNEIKTELLTRINMALEKEGFAKRQWSSVQQVISTLLDELPFNFQPLKTSSSSEAALNTAKNLFVARQVARDSVSRTALTSFLVRRFVSSVQVNINTEHPPLSRAFLPERARLEVEILKNLTYLLITKSHRLRIVCQRGEDIVRTIFEQIERRPELLPDDFLRRYESSSEQRRVICDFVAGMTDRYAVEFYARLVSEEHKTIFKPM